MKSWMVCALLFAVGCGSSHKAVNVTPTSALEVDSATTGSIALVFTRPAKGVTVAIDGELVVDRAHTDRVLIRNVTAGLADLRIAAGSGPARLERDVRVDVEVGRTTTVPLGAPESPETSGYLNAAFSVVAIILSTAITNWLF